MNKEELLKKVFPNGYSHTFVGISLRKKDPKALDIFLEEEKKYLLHKGNNEDEIIQALKYIQKEAEALAKEQE